MGAWSCFRARVVPLLVGLAIAVLPVTARNAAVSGQLVWITAHGGETFYVGNNPTADGSNRQPDFVRSGPRFEHEDYRREASRLLGREVDLATASRFWQQRAVDFIVSDPAGYARLQLAKLDLLTSAYEKGDNLDLDTRQQLIALYRVPWPGFGLVFALAVCGMVGWFWLRAGRGGAHGIPDSVRRQLLADTNPRLATLIGWSAVTLAAGVLLYFVTARYRLPLVVPMLPFAGFAGGALWKLARTHLRLAWVPIVALAVVLAWVHRPIAAHHRNDPSLSASNIGFLYESSGELEQAAAWYRQAITLDPRNALAHFNLGVALRRQARFDDAASAFTAALELSPTYSDAWEQLGMTHEQAGDLDTALDHYRRAIQIEPGRALFHRDLGRVHVLRNELEPAILAWQRAVELDPGDERTRIRLEALLRHPDAPR